MRSALAISVLVFVSGAYAADPPPENGKPLPCDGTWLFQLSRQHLPTAPNIFNYSSKGKEPDEKFAQYIEAGTAKAMIGGMESTIKRGAEKPISVTFAGSPRINKAILSQLAPRLEGARLPYLNFLFVGPPEMDPEVRGLITRLEGTYKFISTSEWKCEATE